MAAWKILHAPVSALNHFLPSSWQWDEGLCFGYVPWVRYGRYLAIGTVAYGFLLFAPWVLYSALKVKRTVPTQPSRAQHSRSVA